MLLNGLTKGVLMLVLGALFVWGLAEAFQMHAVEPTATDVSAPHALVAHDPAKRADTQWMF